MSERDWRIRVEGLVQSYRRRRRRLLALDGIDLRVDEGEMLAVIGGNGSGKTTLLKTLAHVLPPTEGRVMTKGRTSSLIDLAAGFDGDLTGLENLRVGAVLMGMSRAEVEREWDSIIEFSGLDDEALNEPMRTYSSGMGVRLGFSITIHTRPDVLLVDEVMAVGDASFRSKCDDHIATMRAKGCAVVAATHSESVASAADRVLLLSHGKPLYLGDPAEALDRYLAMQGVDADQPGDAA